MLISDLNYLNEVSSASTDLVGGSRNSNYRNTSLYLYDYKDIYVTSDVYGNVAVADAHANAYGRNTDAQTYTNAFVIQGFQSSATSSSIAAANH
jgi:hypothetical protein